MNKRNDTGTANFPTRAWQLVKAEASRQPIQFVLAVVGGLALLYSAIQALPSIISPSHIQAVDLSLFMKASGFVVVQGVLAALFAKAEVAILKMGKGMPIILFLLSTIAACWLSAFITFWVTIPGSTSGAFAGIAYVGASFVAISLFFYFLENYSKSAEIPDSDQLGPMLAFVGIFIAVAIYFAVEANRYFYR